MGKKAKKNNIKRLSSVRDWYDKKIRRGTYVIPICSEALIAGVQGLVKNIYLANGYPWIDILDEKTNKLFKGVNPNYYTTQERFDKYQ